MYNTDLRLEAYEIIQESVSGFKVYIGSNQVGTLEKRGGSWIAAATCGLKIIMIQHQNLEFVLNKLNKLTLGE